MSAGTGHLSSSGAAAKGFPYPAPPSLSEDDFAKVRAAVIERDGGSERSPLSPFVLGASGAGAARGAAAQGKGKGKEKDKDTSPAGGSAAVVSSPSTTTQQKQKQRPQARWGSSSGGGSPAARSTDEKSGVGIDQRLFAPVLRAILAGEGDHVLRRSLLCHPFLKSSSSSTKSSNTSAGGAGSSWGGGSGSLGAKPGAASSPLSGGRRKDSRGSKGGKAKKRDRDRDRAASRNQDDLAGQGQGQGSPSSSKGGTGGERPSPLDVSREMGRLAEGAAADGSLQSTLILVKTLLCAVDPGTKASVLGAGGSPRRQSQQGRSQVAGADDDDSPAHSTGLTLSTAPLRALAGPGLSGWSDLMELLRKEKYRERMVALRGEPSLTVCSGKADMKGRLEAKGECAGVVTAVQVGT